MFPARADVGDAAKLKTVLLDGKRGFARAAQGQGGDGELLGHLVSDLQSGDAAMAESFYDAYKDKGSS